MELHHTVPLPWFPGDRSGVAVDRDNLMSAPGQEERADGPGDACSDDRYPHVDTLGPIRSVP